MSSVNLLVTTAWVARGISSDTLVRVVSHTLNQLTDRWVSVAHVKQTPAWIRYICARQYQHILSGLAIVQRCQSGMIGSLDEGVLKSDRYWVDANVTEN